MAMEDNQLIDEINKLNQDLRDEPDPTTLNSYIDRYEKLLKEAKVKWPNVGRLGIIPTPRKVGDNEPEMAEETQMGILKSAAGQLSIMVNRKARAA